MCNWKFDVLGLQNSVAVVQNNGKAEDKKRAARAIFFFLIRKKGVLHVQLVFFLLIRSINQWQSLFSLVKV